MRSSRFAPRDLALCGVFGAAALLLPVVFHLLRLGHVFMPMYLPLMLLAFRVGPVPAAATSALVPVLSGAATGMPPFFPPVAILMSIELAAMSAIVSVARGRWPGSGALPVLAPVLLMGRVVHVAMVYVLALWLDLPAPWVAGVSLLSGWPGVVLMLVVIPPLLHGMERGWALKAPPGRQ
jgi:hypothetical protein